MAPKPPADPIGRLAETLKKLPGVGARTARRMAWQILRAPKGYAAELAGRITDVAEKTVFCSICQNIAASDPCERCSAKNKDNSIVCVVEEPQDVEAIEKTGVFNGSFHVLHGALSPLEGIGPEDLRIRPLVERLKSGAVKEIILAMNPNAEGEATAHYLAALIEPLGLKVSRIARGVPMGGDLKYIDEVTLGEALEQRRPMTSEMRPKGKQLAK